MLRSLHIENMAVIRSLDVTFEDGLSVVTGETGAGKTVMIGCIAFLLGARPTRELLRAGAETGFVSAVFSGVGEACRAYLAEAGFEAGEELLLQRTLTADGHTQCRLDGRAVTQGILREAAGYLINIHGQNDNQKLLQEAAQAEILDAVADLGGDLTAYRAAYRAAREVADRLAALRQDSAEQERLRDILRYQIAEIDAAKLKAGEEEALLARRMRLQNAERIAKQSEFAYHILHGSEKGAATLILDRAAAALAQLSDMIPAAAEKAEKLRGMRYEIEDIAVTVREYGEDAEGDPTAALDRVEARLDLIGKLRRKYGEDVAAVLAFRAQAAEKLHGLDHSEEEEKRLADEQKVLAAELARLAALLHEKRAAAARKLEKDVLAELAFLDMPSVRFEIALRQTKADTPTGRDETVFLLAANKGEGLSPLSHVASGGELARVMLALRAVLNDRDGVDTAVFDEVDTGISGKTARKIGIKLAAIAKSTQVICITHSAQVASLARTHFRIAKKEAEGRAFTVIEKLDEAGRIAEVSRILGGLQVTKAQEAAAVDMIEEGKTYR